MLADDAEAVDVPEEHSSLVARLGGSRVVRLQLPAKGLFDLAQERRIRTRVEPAEPVGGHRFRGQHQECERGVPHGFAP